MAESTQKGTRTALWRNQNHYRDIGNDYLQTVIAIDPHTPENGCIKVVADSHLNGINYAFEGQVLTSGCSADQLQKYGLGDHKVVDVILEPGDMAFWSPFTFHGSGANLSQIDRRAYINGYVRASNCDRGEYAFRDGSSVPLGEPQLIEYEELYTRPEPHYIAKSP